MLLSALLCLSLLAGCGGSATSEKTAESGELRELDVVLDWYPNALHAFLYEAIDKGYYAEEGLKVNIRFPSNTNDALSLVAAGKADIGLYYQHDVIQARANQNEENFPLSETVERSSINVLLPIMETEDARFLSQSDACWQENIDWMLEQGLISSAPSLDDVRVNLDF